MRNQKSRRCAICGGPLDGRPGNARICGKPPCVRERNRSKALKHSRAHLQGRRKECVVCGGLFRTSKRCYKICSDACRAGRRRSYQGEAA